MNELGNGLQVTNSPRCCALLTPFAGDRNERLVSLCLHISVRREADFPNTFTALLNLLPGVKSITVDKWHDAHRHVRIIDPPQPGSGTSTPRSRTGSTYSVVTDTNSMVSHIGENYKYDMG